MQLKKIYEAADRIAPFALSADCIARGHHDNSGILIDCGREVNKLLFSLDLSPAAAEVAKEIKADCIITHHPAIFSGVMRLGSADAVLTAAMAGISVLSAHLNLDMAEGGIDDCLMQGLGGKKPIACAETLSMGAYGRVYDIQPCSLPQFLAHITREFSTNRTISYGEREVRRVASFCGAGFDEGDIAFAREYGADTFVSSDAKHHLITEVLNAGMNVVILTHYAAENYGFMRFAKRLQDALGIDAETFTDRRLL